MSSKSLAPFLFFILVFSPQAYSQATGSATSPQDLPPEILAYPDLILFGGRILTVDDDFSTAQALAIRDGRILAVGDNSRILRMQGPSTEKIDLQGKTAVPGFIDTHYHLGDYAMRYMLLEEKGIQWAGKIDRGGLVWEDLDMALGDIRRAVDAARPGELIRISVRYGDRIFEEMKTGELDAISPQNPLIVVSQSQQRPQTVNTKAIEMAQIPAGTPGLPQEGAQITGQAVRLLSEYLNWAIPLEEVIPWHKKTMKLVNSWGMTTVSTRVRPHPFNALRELWLQEELTVRWRISFPGPLDIPNTGNVSDIGDDWLRISGAGGATAPGSADALGHWSSKVPPTSEEISGWGQRRRELLETLQYGWSMPNSHVKGDIAVRVILDVIEEAQSNPIVKSSNQRFTMDHMEEINSSDIPRLKQLGVIPSSMMRDLFSDAHPEGSMAYQAVFGADYVNNMLPIKEYLEAGIYPTIEADSGDELHGRPLWTIEKAVCRCVDFTTRERVWGRDQKVSRQDALRMKTIWAAAYVGDKSKLGSLEPGKLADVVVLDGNYMTVPEESISELQVVLTIVGGKVVYSGS